MQYRNKHRSFSRAKRSSCGGSYSELADLAGDIESAVKRGETMFKLSTLHTSFEKRLEELGHIMAVNNSRLKEKRFEHLCNYGMPKQAHGKHCDLAFPAGMLGMLGAAFEQRNMQDQVLLTAKVAKLYRQEMFMANIPSFAGTFSKDCQNHRASQCLKLLAYVLLYGNGMITEVCCTKEVRIIVQLITFNSKKTTKYNSRRSGDERSRSPYTVPRTTLKFKVNYTKSDVIQFQKDSP